MSEEPRQIDALTQAVQLLTVELTEYVTVLRQHIGNQERINARQMAQIDAYAEHLAALEANDKVIDVKLIDPDRIATKAELKMLEVKIDADRRATTDIVKTLGDKIDALRLWRAKTIGALIAVLAIGDILINILLRKIFG